MKWFELLRNWHDSKRSRRDACERALTEFGRTHDAAPMGPHVLRIDAHEAVVRVMFMAGRIPAERCWYVVPRDGGAVRELVFDDVKGLESPWR
ncbi:hypothetical protein [Variovorax sp. RCC_210]|uniref:hypothetical protein n=1 Tax=Variovorax sp. RCC_210 TaxID=3239217 RepID=UPI00352565BF